MRLSAIFLADAVNVNVFREVDRVEMTEGDTVEVYLQLRDVSVQTAFDGYKNPGRRYMPQAGSTLVCTIDSTDTAKVLTKNATQPFSQDPSIWKFTITAADAVKGTKRVKLTLTEPGPPSKVTYGIVNTAISVASVS